MSYNTNSEQRSGENITKGQPLSSWAGVLLKQGSSQDLRRTTYFEKNAQTSQYEKISVLEIKSVQAMNARQSTIQTFKIKENRLRSSKSRLDSYSVNAHGMLVVSKEKVTNKSYEEGEKRGSGT